MIVGTAGHIDHGKTALVKALTGTDADRLAEEKARGITIDLGFAYADLGGGGVTGFVDVPGHERLIRTMLAGAGGIDLVLLVVAADDGVMPQTREHLAILDLLGLTRGIVALTKADLAPPDRRAVVTSEIAALLAGTGLAGSPVLPVSSVTGEGIAGLRAALAEAERETAAGQSGGLFRMAVDRSFTLAGAGTVVTGTVLSGQIAVGELLVIGPGGSGARVRGIHAQNRTAATGHAGQRCALNLAGEGITKESVHRGDMVVTPALHAPTERIDARLYVLGAEAKPVGTWFPARLHSHSSEVGARVVPLEGDIRPGESKLVQLVLDAPLAAVVGDRFILRDVSARHTIGGGQFLDLRPPSRKRGSAARIAALEAAAIDRPGTVLRRLLSVAPVDLPVFLRDRALPEALASDILTEAGGERVGDIALSPAAADALRADLAAILADFHLANPDLAGIGRERLRLALTPRLPKEAFLALLRAEAEVPRVALDGAFVRLPDHAVRLSAEDERLLGRILPDLQGEMRFRPPRVRDFANELCTDEAEVRRVLRMSQKLGWTDQIAQDHFFARAVTAEMAAIAINLSELSPDGWFPAASFRDRLQNGRKVAIEILDFFDRHGLTLRRGDMRRINPHRRDLFGP